jgi:3-oxoacyl-[acyl-carrier-protein] synthase II
MGPNYSISTACATANYCFVSAANHIRNGEADVMVRARACACIYPQCMLKSSALSAECR